jgi:rhodanese-related sulfurtransferase
MLQQLGFSGVSNLDGGTDAWSIQVDSTVARY